MVVDEEHEEIFRVHHPECDWPYCERETPEEAFCEKHDSMGFQITEVRFGE